VHIGKEGNNLEQAERFLVFKVMIMLFMAACSAEQLLRYKEKILQAESKGVKKVGISQRMLYDIKLALVTQSVAALKKEPRH
jgi:hypothetical protein